MTIDDVDQQILEVVQEEALWAAAIIRRLNVALSKTPLRNRVRQLHDEGYLGETQVRPDRDCVQNLMTGYRTSGKGREVLKENCGDGS